MDYIDLERQFVPLKKDEPPALDYPTFWGRKVGGWLGWEQLLQRRRVALLAEALSGKTWELDHQVKALRQRNKLAFFVRIEDLADGGFQAALDADELERFREWKENSSEDAWFFLDSVDEARLNHKSFANALRSFKSELGTSNLNRSFVLVTCRVSDWKGKADIQAMQDWLPYEESRPPASPVVDADEELLAPIFQNDRTRTDIGKAEQPIKASEILVVQIVPLSADQKMRMATAAGIDGPAFLEAVNQSGLESMSERPGDLLELLEYWNEHGQFSSLRDMMASSVARKLRELNPDRGGGLLSPEMARDGAQRLAGALTLAKTFSIKGPLQEPDPTLAKGALDASVVLENWSPDQLGALLRTGLFAPSTYGRIKFHHRSTQEYLAARWLQSLLDVNLPATELRDLLFAEKYGVKTAVPSLLPIAAWLAQSSEQVRNELVVREPVSLIAHGDPKTLPLRTKEDLLESYATLDAKGDLDARAVSRRAAWMFSEPSLGPAIQRAWLANNRADFRLQLLEFIYEGRITTCVDLARQVATAPTGEGHPRFVATQALHACDDVKGLKQVAALLRSDPELFGVSAAPGVAFLLYDAYLTTEDVVDLIDRLKPDEPHSSMGFGGSLAALHGQARDRKAKAALVHGVARIVSRGGLADYPDAKAAARRSDLDEGLPPLVVAELKSAGFASADVIAIIMVLERAIEMIDSNGGRDSVREVVRRDAAINRQLMWADEAFRRQLSGSPNPPVRPFQIGPYTGNAFWSIELADAAWLAKDAASMPLESQRRLAFSALLSLYSAESLMDSNGDQLRALCSGDAALKADFERFTQPRSSDEADPSSVARKEAHRKQTEADKQSWIDFRARLLDTPGLLSNPASIRTWSSGIFRLWTITRWVHRSARREGLKGMHGWKAVARGFGVEVQEHYLKGMSLAWRTIKPERPQITGPNSYTTKNVNSLAIEAIELESLVQADWLASLTPADVQLAARHLLMTSNVRSSPFLQLAAHRPDLVGPILIDALRTELRSGGRLHDVLSYSAHDSDPALLLPVAQDAMRQLKANEPADKAALGYCVQIMKKASGLMPRQPLLRLAQRRLDAHLRASDDDRAFMYLGLLSTLDGDATGSSILRELAQKSGESDADHQARVHMWLGAAFDYRGTTGFASRAMHTMSVSSLTALIRLAYRFVNARDDTITHSETPRDRAQGARNALLDALFLRPGGEAHAAFLMLASEPDFAPLAMRLKELAHRKAQADTEIAPWTAEEVHRFSKDFSAPVKNGMQFMQVAQGILDGIAMDLHIADASTRSLLAMADSERPVQEWLAERLREKSRGRYATHREPEVANRNEPDITLTSHSAALQIAIEVKNANMNWTVKDLERALSHQLAQTYLLPQDRRHGFLVISLHQRRTWRVGSEVWSFERVIAHLKKLALTITSNKYGQIEVAVIALNSVAA